MLVQLLYFSVGVYVLLFLETKLQELHSRRIKIYIPRCVIYSRDIATWGFDIIIKIALFQSNTNFRLVSIQVVLTLIDKQMI